jgi:hypothetical protein
MKLPRNWQAIAAHFRRGGPMQHKNTPRQGGRNESRDLLEEAREEEEETLGEKKNEQPSDPPADD